MTELEDQLRKSQQMLLADITRSGIEGIIMAYDFSVSRYTERSQLADFEKNLCIKAQVPGKVKVCC